MLEFLDLQSAHLSFARGKIMCHDQSSSKTQTRLGLLCAFPESTLRARHVRVSETVSPSCSSFLMAHASNHHSPNVCKAPPYACPSHSIRQVVEFVDQLGAAREISQRAPETEAMTSDSMVAPANVSLSLHPVPRSWALRRQLAEPSDDSPPPPP